MIREFVELPEHLAKAVVDASERLGASIEDILLFCAYLNLPLIESFDGEIFKRPKEPELVAK